MKKITNVMAVAGLLLTTSTGVAFADDSERAVNNGGEKNTPIDLFLDLATNGGGDAKSTPNENSEIKTISGSNSAQKAWGFAYVPKTKEASDRLAEEGPQAIQVLNQGGDASSKSTNIAVKNRTRNKGTWTLKAKLSGTSFSSEEGKNAIAGLKLTLQNPQVKEVKDASEGNSSQLVGVEEGAVTLGSTTTSQQKDGNPIIQLNESESELFNGVGTVVQNGIYDFGFDKATMDIPNVKRVQDGKYSGINIQWTLANVPTAAVAE